MKKTLLFAFILALASSTAFSQVNPHALGIRFGGGNSFGTEISYQHGLSDINRLEVGLGLKTHSDWSGFNLAGAYQWVWNIEGGFNWYAGPGAQLGSWSYKSGVEGSNDGFYIGILGQIGIEYNFSEVPIQIGIDTRPVIGLINSSDDFDIDLSLGIRYVF
jgi:opacity protein-like surface antigen